MRGMAGDSQPELNEAYARAIRDIFFNADYSGSATRYQNPQECWDRFERMLEQLGRPGSQLKLIHVAGTNGKGTTSALCERMLRECGVRVGLFTSPHLHVFRERIRIDGELVSREAVVGGMARVTAASHAVGGASPFEKLTALALVCFEDSGVEWAVLETGLGGKWDATNHFRPAVCGICKIGLDHMNVLGDTLGQIAGEKAGIIKTGIPAFSVKQEPEACAVLHAVATSVGAELRVGELEPVSNLPVWLQPAHQAENAALASSLVRSLAERGLKQYDADACGRALIAARWPARFEVVEPSSLKGRRLLLDVAHNQPAIRALVSSVLSTYPAATFSVILGANKDKDLTAILQEMGELGQRLLGFVAIASSHPKSTPAVKVAELGRSCASACDLQTTWLVAESMLHALELATSLFASGQAYSNELVLCCGSVFVAAEMREALARAEPALFAASDWVFQDSEPPLVMG